MKFEYVVESYGDYAAGIHVFTEDVCIEIKDFVDDAEQIADATEHFRQSIAEWYDGAGVSTKADYEKRQAEIDKAMEPEPDGYEIGDEVVARFTNSNRIIEFEGRIVGKTLNYWKIESLKAGVQGWPAGKVFHVATLRARQYSANNSIQKVRA